jgi:uncharacterized protein
MGWLGSTHGDAAKGCGNGRRHHILLHVRFASVQGELGGCRGLGQEGRQGVTLPVAEPPIVLMNVETSRFEVTLEGETAFAEYRLHPGEGYVTLPHTIVPPALEGKGVGSALARAALGYAREHGLKVKPLCPFIARYITIHPEWQDLMLAEFRAGLGLSS